MTNTIFYSIPFSFFPGYKVVHPFHAKVKYEFDGKEVKIVDVCLSEECLKRIDVRGLVDRMKKDIAELERKKTNSPVHPTIMSAIAPHI